MSDSDVKPVYSPDLVDYSNILKHNLTSPEVSQFYSKYSKKYDEFMGDIQYRGPTLVSTAVKDHYGDNTDIRILDLAAGTGILGQQLKDLGFTRVDALEPCVDMLNKAKAKGIYENMYCEYLSEEKTSIPDDTYDCLVMSGGMCTNHMPCSVLLEVIRITKPGGIFVNIMQTYYLESTEEYRRLEPYMAELEEAGKWRRLLRTVAPDYCRNRPGVLTAFEVTESGCAPFTSAVLAAPPPETATQ